MKAREAAARKLSAGSKTCSELKTCLLQKGFAREEVEQVISDFLDYGYLDDERYCREYFRYAFGKGKAKGRVFRELRTKGVPEELISAAYEEYDGSTDEYERAKRECLKILQAEQIEEGGDVPEKLIGRIGRNLSRKGYSADILYRIIGELRK